MLILIKRDDSLPAFSRDTGFQCDTQWDWWWDYALHSPHYYLRYFLSSAEFFIWPCSLAHPDTSSDSAFDAPYLVFSASAAAAKTPSVFKTPSASPVVTAIVPSDGTLSAVGSWRGNAEARTVGIAGKDRFNDWKHSCLSVYLRSNRSFGLLICSNLWTFPSFPIAGSASFAGADCEWDYSSTTHIKLHLFCSSNPFGSPKPAPSSGPWCPPCPLVPYSAAPGINCS